MTTTRTAGRDGDPAQGKLDFDNPRGHLDRVSTRIGAAIIAYCRQHEQFHVDDLRKHVIREVGIVAPASSDRILRQLRQQKRLDYKVVSRRESLYQVLEVA